MEPYTLFLGVAGTDYGGQSRITLGGWREDGSREDWLTVLNGGNVGIGTNAPAAKRHVLAEMGSGQANDGGILFQHSNQTQGIGFGYNTIYATGANGDQYLGLQSRGAGSLLLNPAGGNVGIGPVVPAQSLHTGGNIHADGGEYQSWGPITLHPDTANTGDGIVRFVNGAGTETMRVASNGYVGIGTASPGAFSDYRRQQHFRDGALCVAKRRQTKPYPLWRNR